MVCGLLVTAARTSPGGRTALGSLRDIYATSCPCLSGKTAAHHVTSARYVLSARLGEPR